MGRQLAAVIACFVPESTAAVSAAIVVGSVVSLGVTMSACSRFTRR